MVVIPLIVTIRTYAHTW